MTRITAVLVVMLIIAILPGRNAQAQERTLKSKYEFGTPELDAAQKLYSGKKYPEALAAFQSIIDKAQANSNWEELVYAMEKKGLSLRLLRRYDEGIKTLDEAIRIASQELPKDHFLNSKVYYGRGVIDHRLNDFYSARAYLDTALRYYSIADTYDSTAYSSIIRYKYYAYQYSQGSQDTLLKYLDELVALETVQQLKAPKPDDMLLLLQSYPAIHIQKGDFELALAHAIKGYKYARENREKVSNRYFAEAQYFLAQVLFYKKEFKRAIQVGQEAMPMVERTPRNQMPEYYSFNNLMGISFMAIGQPDAALPFLEKALKIAVFDQNGNLIRNRAKFRAQVKINVGLCYKNLGDGDRGKKYLDESLSDMKDLVTIPNSDLHLNYKYLGDYYFNNGDWKSSLISYDSALRNGLISYSTGLFNFPEGNGDIFSYENIGTLSKKAASMKFNALDEAEPIALLKSAKLYVENIHELLLERRSDFVATAGKLFLSQNFKGLYETGIDICLELYRQTENIEYFYDAMEFARESKAILFLEQSQEFDLVNNDFLDQEIKNLFFLSKSKVEKLQKTFYTLIDNSNISDSLITINEELLNARQDNEHVKDSIESILSEYGEGGAIFQRLVRGEKELVVKKGQAIIEFFYGDENIFVLAKNEELVSFHKIELNDELERSLQAIVTTISSPPNVNIIDSELLSFRKHSSRVYDLLLKPTIDKFGSGVNHLVIIPDEFLSRIPFEILIKKSKATRFDGLDYLVKSYSIQYELSTELFSNASSDILAKKGLLGIGFKQLEPSQTRSGFGSLPGTEKEINFLQANLEGTFLIGNEGTKGGFLNLARDYDVLHLAVHGKADSLTRGGSSLVFNGQDNNVLNTDDLYLAGLKARLAVLSACESGIGVINKGEGTFSIARGFALVGVPSIVMSLWKVDDQATSTVMVDMYKGFIKNGLPINDALRQAKLSYLKKSDEYSAHPYYWAAFLHLGKNIKLEREKPSPWIYPILGLGVIILLIIFFRRKRKRAI